MLGFLIWNFDYRFLGDDLAENLLILFAFSLSVHFVKEKKFVISFFSAGLKHLGVFAYVLPLAFCTLHMHQLVHNEFLSFSLHES